MLRFCHWHLLVVGCIALSLILSGSVTPDLLAAQPSAAAFQNSLALDGTGDYVEVASDPALTPASALTIEAWVRRSSSSRCDTIISKDFQSAYWLGLCNQKIRFYSGGGAFQDGVTAIPANVWTHIAVTWQSGGQQKYYINGALDYMGSAGVAPSTNGYAVFIGADPGPALSLFAFWGNLAEVRLWNLARSQDDIRRTMHVALDEPRPGLVSVWHLSDDFNDSIGGHHGTPRGNASLAGPQAPPRPAVVYPDANFNTLPATRYAAATTYVPLSNRALLLGGVRAGVVSNSIDAVDVSSGASTSLGTLPANRAYAAAAYASGNDTVYLFGGSTTSAGTDAVRTIYAVNPTSGATRTLATLLPTAARSAVAVYHPRLDKIYVFGGRNPGIVLTDMSLFSPASETISATVGISLPSARYEMAAAYSAATDKIYTFGGLDGTGTATDTIFEIAPSADGTTATITQITTARLAQASSGLAAVEDPVTQLIYLIGGTNSDRVAVFDPVTGQLWQTTVKLAAQRVYSSVAYDSRNRHALVMGGYLSSGQNNVWRVRLGNGPLVALGRWDFPLPVGAAVNAIAGGEKRVFVATQGDGLWRYNETGGRTHYTAAALGSANGIVYDVHYNAPTDETFVATDDAGGKYIPSSGTATTYGPSLGTNRVFAVDVTPGYSDLNSVPVFFGTDIGLMWGPRLVLRPAPHYEWLTTFSGQRIDALAHRGNGDLGVIVNGVLKRMTYNWSNGSSSVSDLGLPCGWEGRMLAFSNNGDRWLPVYDSIESLGHGLCRIAAASTTGSGSILPTDVGDEARAIDRDADGRMWVAIGSSWGTSGGLAVYETVGSATNPTIRFEATNWLTAPVGSRTILSGAVVWDSGFTSVGAADERVWAGRSNGQLVTVAQRWQQLDESNDLDQKVIEGVWAVRGRLFLATSSSLHVLMPDGQTWDNRSGIHVRAVLGDSRGRVWIGTDSDVRLYTPSGWDLLTTAEGTPPVGPVYALAEDGTGRIWIGGAGGLTLFDRERFVLTFNTTNSNLPNNVVRTLLADRDNRLWIGTDNGLARLDGDLWINFNTSSGLPSNAIHDLAQVSTGEIAVSTGGGLSLYNGTTFFTETMPIASANLPLTVDDLGRLWAGSAVRTATGWQGYWSTNSGLRSSTVGDNAADGADRVWFSHAPGTGVSVRGTLLPPLANTIPIVNGISPDHGKAGTTVVINGSGFGSDAAAIQLTVGGAPLELTGVQDTTITGTLTANNISGDVSVSVGGRTTTFRGSGRPAFCAEPTISSYSPTGGNSGVAVEINGTNFDPNTRVYLGSSTAHTGNPGPTHLEVFIQSSDGTGQVRVENGIAGCPAYSSTASGEFRRINLSVADVVLNQGLQSYPLVAGKPTLVQHYLLHSIAPRSTDKLEIDTIQFTFTDTSSGASKVFSTSPLSDTIPSSDGSQLNLLRLNIENSVNTTLTPEVSGDQGGTWQVATVLKRRDQAVASASRTFTFEPNRHLRVLLIPIMWEGYTDTQLQTMKTNVDRQLDDLRRRLMPLGTADFSWSFTVIERARSISVPIPGNPYSYTVVSNTLDIGSWWDLYNSSHDLEDARSTFNSYDEFHPQALVAFGIAEAQMNSNPSTTGYGLWPDLSDFLNTILLTPLDALCDLLTAPLQWVGLSDGCDIDIPLYVGWAAANTTPDSRQYSALIGHELGHVMSLVKPTAYNGFYGRGIDPDDLVPSADELAHSVNDELNGGQCSGGTSFNILKTLYLQPGVENTPIVNPIEGRQIYPGSMETVADAQIARGKAIMSYACQKNNDNSFFEPADVPHIFAEYAASSDRGWLDDLLPGLALSTVRVGVELPRAQRSAVQLPNEPGLVGAGVELLRQQASQSATQIPGERLYVSGVVTRTTDMGEIRRVESRGTRGHLTMSAATGHWLVQLDNTGRELGRTGVYPAFVTRHSFPHDSGFFAATILRQPGVARIELRHDDRVLATFQPGAAAPTVSISSPSGGSYSSGSIPVTWTTSDPDGDPLEITILYSADGGVSWRPVALSRGSGTVDVRLSNLAGSANARFRVIATDGLNTGSATSPAFTVAGQPPRPFITYPTPDSSFLEGQLVTLSGGADDNQDGMLGDSRLRWRSRRDGDLGSGARLSRLLSVGTHVLTLQATNSAGLQASTSVTVVVQGDYDHDGLRDSDELAMGLSPLTMRDAYSDRDGDGLPLIVELRRGLNPNSADTDGDGRRDGDELLAGTNPAKSDAPRPPDQLEVYPRGLSFTADLSLDKPFPQQVVQVVSRMPAPWTLTSDVDWLGASRASGATVSGVTIILQASRLSDGVHNGNLYFASASLGMTVSVPVTATISRSAAYFDLNRDGLVNIIDVQQVAGRIPSDNSRSDFRHQYDMDRDGDIDANDARLIAPRWTVTPMTATIPVTSPTVSVINPASVGLGAIFTVNVVIDSIQNLGGFAHALAFNPTVLQVEEATLGGLLGSTGRTVRGLGPQIDNQAGRIAFGGYSYGVASGPNGNGILARVRFRAVALGASALDLQYPLLVDIQGKPTRATDGDGAIQVVGTAEYRLYLPQVIR